MNFVASLNNYISLTKPTIVMSFAITGLTAMVVEGSLLQEPFKFFFIVLAIVFTAASANAFNQYFERDLDAQMERTRNRRPLPQNKIKPSHALIFSILIGFIAVFYLSFWVNFLSAAVALGTIVFYAFFYTLWLKPRTPYHRLGCGNQSCFFHRMADVSHHFYVDPAAFLGPRTLCERSVCKSRDSHVACGERR